MGKEIYRTVGGDKPFGPSLTGNFHRRSEGQEISPIPDSPFEMRGSVPVMLISDQNLIRTIEIAQDTAVAGGTSIQTGDLKGSSTLYNYREMYGIKNDG